jgi:hypothetical protein
MASEEKVRIWKASSESKPGFLVSDEMAVMAANNKNFIVVDQQGTNIAGPVSFMTTSEQIRQGGLFVQMNDFVKMIPGTIVTPIPQQIPFPPVALIASVALSMPLLLALLK